MGLDGGRVGVGRVWRSHDPLSKHGERVCMVSTLYLDLYYHNVLPQQDICRPMKLLET